ncbi:hypothetical protein PT277_07040 [Acetobacteraceae bacterium ESL0709]|nr:hypothetical protein [Acetobacteraceae bacterium ESL0697]MDF7678447.1 hypothetical protein [Acetobacteraceae bacterium ESL0709]
MKAPTSITIDKRKSSPLSFTLVSLIGGVIITSCEADAATGTHGPVKIVWPGQIAKSIPQFDPAYVSPSAEDRMPESDYPIIPSGQLKIGGAIRGRYDLRFNDVTHNTTPQKRKTSKHLSYDTFIFTMDYDSPVIFGATQYRLYGGNFMYGKRGGYKDYPGEISFPLYAYVGAKINAANKITIGLQPVAFDDQFYGSSFLNSMGFVFGLEETYNVGIDYAYTGKRYSAEIGYFPQTAPNAFGISRDSARYSVNIVNADSSVPGGTHNVERNMLIGRTRYQLLKWKEGDITATGSFWLSQVHNLDTHGNGLRRAFSFSLKGTHGLWYSKLLYARQDIGTANPRGYRHTVTVGDYDSAYNIAGKGNLFFVEIGRTIHTGRWFPFDMDVFADYNVFLKDMAGYKNSQRATLGIYWHNQSKRLRIWSEVNLSKNDPYVGAGQFSNGAAHGGDNKYKKSFLIIFGYYF